MPQFPSPAEAQCVWSQSPKLNAQWVCITSINSLHWWLLPCPHLLQIVFLDFFSASKKPLPPTPEDNWVSAVMLSLVSCPEWLTASGECVLINVHHSAVTQNLTCDSIPWAFSVELKFLYEINCLKAPKILMLPPHPTRWSGVLWVLSPGDTSAARKMPL